MDDEPAPVFAPRIKESLLQRMQDNLFVPIAYPIRPLYRNPLGQEDNLKCFPEAPQCFSDYCFSLGQLPRLHTQRPQHSIRAILTVGCYAVGLKSLVDGRSMLGQKMMYCRCLFQGVAVSAMFFDQFTRKSKSDR
ncbi:Hypoxia induced protein, domain [Cinara cedri]|uniref:Hypoxia induced protein, domain n=1 Tax=Cinara cedri TaxID=506608 RepID=A0A5E4MKL4_9HEMI|nr:Hypoxia induced protein, domain [Cinara cedri]